MGPGGGLGEGAADMVYLPSLTWSAAAFSPASLLLLPREFCFPQKPRGPVAHSTSSPEAWDHWSPDSHPSCPVTFTAGPVRGHPEARPAVGEAVVGPKEVHTALSLLAKVGIPGTLIHIWGANRDDVNTRPPGPLWSRSPWREGPAPAASSFHHLAPPPETQSPPPGTHGPGSDVGLHTTP